MLPFLRDHPAIPAACTPKGRVTRVALEDAREQVAAFFGARPREVVFTSSGTEAVNAAIWGALARAAGGGHVVTTAVEHSCVRDAIERAGAATCTVVGVDRLGRFDAADGARRGPTPTPRSSVVAARQPRGRHAATGRGGRARRARERGVLVHVDACAAVGSRAGRLRARSAPTSAR